MPPPAGPQSGVPAAFVPRDSRSSIVYVFQTTLPVSRSSAERLPRNVQHSYSGRPPCTSSFEPLHGHEEAAVVVRDRARDRGERMLVELAFQINRPLVASTA